MPTCIYDLYEKPKTFDEKMAEGKSRDAGLAGSMSIRDESYPPYRDEPMRRASKHATTRCNHES